MGFVGEIHGLELAIDVNVGVAIAEILHLMIAARVWR